MSSIYHAVVWVDHGEAKIYRFGRDSDSEVDIHSHISLQRLHHQRTGWQAGGNPPDDTEFFQRILGALDHAGRTILTGPGNAKDALKRFLDRTRPTGSWVLDPEPMSAPTTDALLTLGNRYFEHQAAF
jgi:stalled ribosome rescue protein Dom34